MAVPDTKHSIVIKKTFPYRDGTRVWSNRYHFEGALPTDDTAWTTLSDAIVAAEKLIYKEEVVISEAVGYDSSTATSTNPHGDAVFVKTYSVAGAASWSVDGGKCPGDCAIFLRYNTPARSSRNHPVYLSNYFHGAHNGSSGGDQANPEQVTAVEDYADAWMAGFSDGTVDHQRCGPRGAVATARAVSGFVRHRDFPA